MKRADRTVAAPSALTSAPTSVRLLGPIDLEVDGAVVALTSDRQRRLLLALALRPGTTVNEGRLVEYLWSGDDQPANPRAALQTYVSRLRSHLGADAIERRSDGYALVGVPVDVGRFEALLDEADRAIDPHEIRTLLTRAHELIRGPVLGELAYEDWSTAEAHRIEEEVIRAREALLAARIELDEQGALSDLQAFVRDHPLREQAQELLARSLYAAGRHAEALRAIRSYRRHLGSELGLEPGPSLVDLERQIHAHDQGLDIDVAPRHIAGYQLDEKIGEGTFGEIYKARQPSVGREVAIKVVKAELANDSEFVRRFEVEAQTVARLEHPHIVPLYDFWRDHSGAYLVMRYIRGGNVEERLVRDGAWRLPDVARLLDEVGAALAVAHQAGVVHRDIKPANVLIDEDDNFYLGDFGIAVDAAVADAGMPTAGSPLYAAPEQVGDGRLTPASDIYAFGIMLYELFSGTAPFDDSTSLDILMSRKRREQAPSLASLRPDLPSGIDIVIRTATTPDPTKRFATMAEFVLAFRAAATPAMMGATSTHDVDIPEAPQATVRPRERAGRTLVAMETAYRQPYKGLAAFAEADAPDFFGRDALTDELVEHLESSRLLVVTGPSGSGKSSVVRAGLLPRLRSGGRLVAAIVPGIHPMDEVETALSHLSTRESGPLLDQLLADERGLARAIKQTLPDDGTELVLVVDQFEELFTLAAAEQRDHFLSALAWAITDPHSRLRVVATLRADFYDRPLQHPATSELVRVNTVAVSPLTGGELEQAISQPAAHVEVALQPALLAELVGEVTGQPAALPLLQYVLTETFQRRSGGEMTLESYREIGGIAGALAHRADEIIADLGEEREGEVRRLFTRLITLGEGTEDTRRRVLLSEVHAVGADVVDAYGAARLLTFDRDPSTREPTVEVAHEALIREWPRLRQWLADDRDDLRVLRHLSGAASDWVARGRLDSDLYRGGRLETADELLTRRADDLSESEVEFVRAAIDRRDAEQAEEQARVRRLRRLVVAAAMVAVIALVAGALAFQQRGIANDRSGEARIAAGEAERSAAVALTRQEEAQEAEAGAQVRRLSSEAGFRVESDRQLALLLAVEAYQLESGPASIGALQRALTGIGTYLGAVESGVRHARVSWLDADSVVVAGPSGIRLVDVATADVAAERDTPVAIRPVDPGDGAVITRALASIIGRTVAFVPAADEQQVVVARLAPGSDGDSATDDIAIEVGGIVDGIAVSPDGGRVAIIDQFDELTMHDAVTGRRLWSVTAHPETTFGELDAPDGVEPHQFYVNPDEADGFTTEKTHHHLVFSPDGSEVLSQEGIVRRWDVDTGRQIGDDVLVTQRRAGLDDTLIVTHPRVTYLGNRVGSRVTVHDQANVSVLDLETGEMVESIHVAGAADAYGLPKIDTVHWHGDDQAWVLLNNGELHTLDISTGEPVEPVVDTQLAGAADIAISPDGDRIAVAGAAGVFVFSLDGTRLLADAVPRGTTQTGSISPDGRYVFGDNATGVEWFEPGQIYDISGDEPVLVDDRPDELLFNHSAGLGSSCKAVTREFWLRLYDCATREPLGPPLNTGFTWSGQAATNDNRLVAAGTGNDGIVVFDVATGEEVAQLPELGNSVGALSFNPDGTRLAAASSGPAMVWETETWTVVDDSLGEGGAGIITLRYSPDGESLVTMDVAGDLAVRDPVTHEVRRTLVGSGSPDIADGLFFFADDGRYLVNAADSSARMWDLIDGESIGDPFPNDPDNRIGGADGLPRFVTAVGPHRLVWEVDVNSWPGIACQAAGRNLTRAEWDQFGLSTAYHKTCEQWEATPERVTAAAGDTAETAVSIVDASHPLVVLADTAAAEVDQLLTAGDTTTAEVVCERWSGDLAEAATDEALAEAGLAGNETHPYWTIERAMELCAGQSFTRAADNLRFALEDDICGGYPSPCPQPRDQ